MKTISPRYYSSTIKNVIRLRIFILGLIVVWLRIITKCKIWIRNKESGINSARSCSKYHKTSTMTWFKKENLPAKSTSLRDTHWFTQIVFKNHPKQKKCSPFSNSYFWIILCFQQDSSKIEKVTRLENSIKFVYLILHMLPFSVKKFFPIL